MMLTEEMIAKDEERWHSRNIVAELGYCGKNIRHRKNVTNDDIRFYAYIMRKAYALLKEQEPIEPITSDGDDLYWQPGDEDYACGACGEELAGSWWVYCPYCGRKVKWDD